MALVGAGSASGFGYAGAQARQSEWTPPNGQAAKIASLSVRTHGVDGSPVMLLHGLMGSGSYWGGTYDRLAGQHRLIVPDLLGFGRSAGAGTTFGPDDHVAAILSVLDELGIIEPVVIGAHSLGASIAIRFAVTDPDRVRSVVAFDAPVYRNRVDARRHVARPAPPDSARQRRSLLSRRRAPTEFLDHIQLRM